MRRRIDIKADDVGELLREGRVVREFEVPPAMRAEAVGLPDRLHRRGRDARDLRHRARGIVVNAKKVRRLMRENELNPRTRRRFSRTTDSSHDGPVFPFVAKGLVVDGPDQLWVGDITYVGFAQGFVDLSVILDAWSPTRPKPPPDPFQRQRRTPGGIGASLRPGHLLWATGRA
jgi:transposase InsO family protein